MGVIPSGFDEVKLALYEVKMLDKINIHYCLEYDTV